MVTGETRRDQVLNALEAGATDYLAKPFDHAALRKKLAKFCRNQPPKQKSAIPQARDAMGANFRTIRADASVGEAIRCLLRNDVCALPVIDGDENLIGMITEFQLTRAIYGRDIRAGAVRDLMTKDAIVANETTALPLVITTMDKYQLAVIPVTRSGKVVGTITRRDLLRFSFPQ
jgi:CBS domain-containing protein